MTLQEAIEARHSLRAYKELPLAEDVVKVLEEQIGFCKGTDYCANNPISTPN